MCGWFVLSPEGRTNPLTMSLTHLSSDRDSLVGKGAGEAVTPWVSVLRVFPAPVLSRSWKGRSSHRGGVTVICPHSRRVPAWLSLAPTRSQERSTPAEVDYLPSTPKLSRSPRHGIEINL